MIKRVVFAVSLVFIVATAAFGQDSNEELAKQYVKLTSSKESIEDVLTSIFDPQRTGTSRSQIDRALKAINFSVIERVAVDSVSRRMTKTELKAAISYLSSPEGKSVMQKQRDVVRDIAPVVQQEVVKALSEMLKGSPEQLRK